MFFVLENTDVQILVVEFPVTYLRSCFAPSFCCEISFTLNNEDIR